MKTFNLKKKASSEDFTINEKMLGNNRENMNLSINQQKVVEKNINLSLPVKNKDNTVPFNKQLDAERKNKEEGSIIEAKMDDKIIEVGDKTTAVMPINVETEKYNKEHLDKFKEAEKDSKIDTEFWDKYVGVQLEGKGFPTKVDDNIPTSASQLENQPDRFKGKDVDKMVMASMKDADAMLFHIHATAARAQRELNEDEKQQIIDINSGKMRLIAQMVQPVRRSLEYSSKSLNHSDPVIKEELGIGIGGKGLGVGVYEDDGTKIDEFKSCDEAKANYPEGKIESKK